MSGTTSHNERDGRRLSVTSSEGSYTIIQSIFSPAARISDNCSLLSEVAWQHYTGERLGKGTVIYCLILLGTGCTAWRAWGGIDYFRWWFFNDQERLLNVLKQLPVLFCTIYNSIKIYSIIASWMNEMTPTCLSNCKHSSFLPLCLL